MKKLKHDLKAMKKAITGRTKVVFIANPNNPTGTYVSSSEVAEFMKGMKEKNILVVFDEAYKEYVCEKDYPETVKYVRDGYPVIVLRTFSKIYSLAGLRAGYGISGENVNSVAQAAAIASLNDSLRVEKYRRLAFNEKIKLQNALEKSGIEFLPSAANFILIKVGNGRKVFNSLLRKGIIVRAMEEYELPEYIRVTIGLPEENKLFLKALKEVINEKN
jgi:histidinol-phosphate aminotransferase